MTRSLRACIEAAVLELIYQGDEKGFWEIKDLEEEEVLFSREIEENENENVK